jgi:hypothetical protein
VVPARSTASARAERRYDATVAVRPFVSPSGFAASPLLALLALGACAAGCFTLKSDSAPPPLASPTGGTWERVTDWNDEVAVHSILLPSGRVLYWPRYNGLGMDVPSGAPGAQTPAATVWDPTLPVGDRRYTTVPNSRTNLLTAAHALLADGRVLAVGGLDSNAGGNDDRSVLDVNLFDPATQTWSAGPDMNVARGFGALAPLANGQMLAIGGVYGGTHDNGAPNQPVELYRLGGWSGFAPIATSSDIAKQVVAVRSTATGRLDLVMINPGLGNMYRSQEQPDGQFPAGTLVGAASNRAQRITAVALPNGGLDVYMIGLDRQMWHKTSNADGSIDDFASGNISTTQYATDISVVRKPSGQISAFIVDPAGGVRRSDQGSSGDFPAFQSIPFTTRAAANIAAVLRADGSIELVMTNVDGRVWHAHENTDGTFTDFALGPIAASSLRVVSLTASVVEGGRLRVYAIGTQNGSSTPRLWRSDEQADGSYTDLALHPVTPPELAVGGVSSAPNQALDDLVILDVAQKPFRNRQAADKWGWSELDVLATSSNTDGWSIRTPWPFLAPNGQVFVASGSTRSFWIDTTASKMVEGPARGEVRINGTAVMYEPGKILVTGGASPAALDSSEVIDLNAPTPAWRAVGSMHSPRQHATATLLPDGRVLVTSGTRAAGFDPIASQEDPGQAVLPAEIWDPVTELWTEVNASPEARTYQSGALLLPDGRVLVSGGGQGGSGSQPNGAPGVPDHPSADLYSPPYLFRGARPVVTTAPATIAYGASFQVASPDAARVAKASLVRLGATAHAFNANQRFAWLTVQSTNDGQVSLAGPADANQVPPGHYLLHLLDADGVPSIGRVVLVGPQ